MTTKPRWSRRRGGNKHKHATLGEQLASGGMRIVTASARDACTSEPNAHSTTTGQLPDVAGKHYACADALRERNTTHVIPRESRSEQLALAHFPQAQETIPLRWRQLDAQGKELQATSAQDPRLQEHMVSGTNERRVWQSDKSLLLPGKPGSRVGYIVREGTIQVGRDRRTYRQGDVEQPSDIDTSYDVIDTGDDK